MPSIKSQLIFVHSNYGFLCEVIKKLEGRNSLKDVVDLINNSVNKINDVKGSIGQKIIEKLNNVLLKNKGFLEIRKLAEILEFDENYSQTNYTIKEVCAFKYAPVTSVDVERSFSLYKNFLRPNRESFVFENLKKNFFVYANNAIN